LNLLCLGLWLALIHWLFAVDWASVVAGFTEFVQAVAAALSRNR
jgi:hypothetical protein